MASVSLRSLLRAYPIYARVFWCDVLAEFGKVTLWVVYPLFVLGASGDRALSGVALSGEVISFGLLSPVAGAGADRGGPRRVLQAAAWVRLALLLFLLSKVTVGASLGFYLALSAGLGAAGAFFVPARAAFVRRLLEGHELEEAVAASGTANFLIRMFAPAVMGLWLAIFPVWSGLLLDLAAYAAILILLSPGWVNAPRLAHVRASGWLEGWRLLTSTRFLRWLILLDFQLTFLAMAGWVMSLALLEEHLGLPARLNGWLMAVAGLAGAAGTRLAGRLSGGAWVWTGSVLLLSLSNLGIPWVSSLEGAMVAWMLRGLAIGILVVKMEQAVALSTPPEAMGRVQAAWNVVICLAAFAGSVSTPWLLRNLGAADSFALCGWLLLGVAAWSATVRNEA